MIRVYHRELWLKKIARRKSRHHFTNTAAVSRIHRRYSLFYPSGERTAHHTGDHVRNNQLRNAQCKPTRLDFFFDFIVCFGGAVLSAKQWRPVDLCSSTNRSINPQRLLGNQKKNPTLTR